MRPIEFRAWYIDEGVMAYSDDDAEFDIAYWDGANCSRIAMINYLCKPLNMILMQYTGLQDANGQKIFEADVLDSHIGQLTVVFKEGEFLAKITNTEPGKLGYEVLPRHFYQLEIIGNIYQNKELLNEVKNEQ